MNLFRENKLLPITFFRYLNFWSTFILKRCPIFVGSILPGYKMSTFSASTLILNSLTKWIIFQTLFWDNLALNALLYVCVPLPYLVPSYSKIQQTKMLVMCTRFGDLITLIFVFTFQYMKFWTKSLYMVEKFLLAKKKNVTKIFEKNQLFSKSLLRSAGGGTFRLHFRNLQKIWW